MEKTKTQFVKNGADGGSILNTLVNKLPFEMHLPGHNFTGPATKLYKRLNPDETPKGENLRERIDNSIVGKLINAKVNFGLGLHINFFY